MRQRTISESVEFTGICLHSGRQSRLVVRPAPVDSGYVFVRSDLAGKPQVRAVAENVSGSLRSTVVACGDAKVGTVEHLLAAAYAMNIDNAIFDIDGDEVPILDGSAKVFTEAFARVGTQEQDAELVIYNLSHKLSLLADNGIIEYQAFPDDNLTLTTLIDYHNGLLANHYARLSNINGFANEIACCRTFVMLSDIVPLLQRNLIKGGDLDNAIVIVDKEFTQAEFDDMAAIFHKPSLHVQPCGVLNNLKLHFSNEPARHKLLDLLGDLALTGFRFNANIIAVHPGHHANAAFANIIRQDIINHRIK